MEENAIACNGLLLNCVGWVFTLCAVAAAVIPRSPVWESRFYIPGGTFASDFCTPLVEGFVYCRSLGKCILALGVAAALVKLLA